MASPLTDDARADEAHTGEAHTGEAHTGEAHTGEARADGAGADGAHADLEIRPLPAVERQDPRLRADGLDLSIGRGDGVVELRLAGDLDMATAPRLRQAMAWLRFGEHHTIVVDARALDFVAAAGYRALQAASLGPDGRPDPRVTCLVGPAVARLESAIARSTRA